MTEANYKSGFVSMIGRPNVGKSTLLNRIIGQKITIISDKPQTTRNKIQGVLTTDKSQIVFIDTPGIHKPKHKLGKFMVHTAESALQEVDVVLFLINAEEGYGKGDQFIMNRLKEVNRPIFLVINKIDLIHPEKLLPLIDHYNKQLEFAEIIPISAQEGNNVSVLLDNIINYLPEGPQYYPDDQITDHPERFLIAEMIREKIIQLTKEEIPHSVAVDIDAIEKRSENTVYIQAVIITERPSQKGIIIGKQGQMLKKIGSTARKDIEALLGSNIFLDLWIKVQKDWRNKERHLNDFGYRHQDY